MGFADLLATADRVTREQLGESVVYVPGAGSPATVTGVFDQAYVRVDSTGQPGVSSQGPAVFLTLADLPTDPEVDTAAAVTIRAVTYIAHTVEKDGQGGVLLHLSRV